MKYRSAALIVAVSSLVIPFFSMGAAAIAQYRIGMGGGINVASLAVSPNDFYWDESRTSSYIGPAIGGIMQFDISDISFIRAEPRYIQKGANHRFDYTVSAGPAQTIEVPLKLEFLEFPVSIGVRIGSGSLRPYVLAGPSIAYMLTRGYSKTDIALNAGVGAEYALSTNCSVLMDVRYSAGLNNLNTNDPGAPALTTRGIQPLIGVLVQQ